MRTSFLLLPLLFVCGCQSAGGALLGAGIGVAAVGGTRIAVDEVTTESPNHAFALTSLALGVALGVTGGALAYRAEVDEAAWREDELRRMRRVVDTYTSTTGRSRSPQ